MKETSTEQMDASLVFCSNLDCKARGQVGQAPVVMHSRSRPRYRGKACGKTFSAREGTMFAGLRKPTEVFMTVVTLLAYGCPIQAIVQAFGLDERTVASWRDRAGKHCQQVHQAVVQQGQLDLVHVQADEIRVKGCKMVAWMALAMMVPTRLWLGGVVSLTRKCRHAARRLAGLESGMWLLGCTYNLCWPHHELSRQAAKAQERRGEVLLTPAMASGLTDHIWSIQELLSYRVAPVPWVAPKRRGRPKKLV